MWGIIIVALPALALTVGQHALLILVLPLFFTRRSIHGQWTRFLNYLAVAITLNGTWSTSVVAVSLLWNGPSEVLTWFYPVLILLVFNHASFLLYIFSFMVILIQLLFTSASTTIYITSLMMIILKVYNLIWLSLSDAFPITPMFWN